MQQGVVFKQRYKSVNVKSTPVLNGKHLMYIATRKGAIHNPDCSFGLFGRLPGMTEAEDINRLDKAHAEIMAVSRQRTIYRVVLSVDGETAKQHDLYSRDTWQRLVMDKIGVIAREMEIEPKDFNWAASMHYAKGHPHVHVMYWDNGNKVRREHVPEERFEIMAERVRAEFSRELFREEIAQRRTGVKESLDKARLEISALCTESNVKEALNFNNITLAKLDAVGRQLYDLVLTCPRSGSLKYAYLPEAYKKQVNELIGEIMKIPDFLRLQKRYLKLTDEISTLYGNGVERKAYNREQAMKKLYTALGNDIMSFIKSYRQELARAGAQAPGPVKGMLREDVLSFLQENTQFKILQGMFPARRTPLRDIMTEDFRRQKDETVKAVMNDMRIRSKVRAYLRSQGTRVDGGPAASPDAERNRPGETADDREETYSDAYRAASEIVMEKLYADAGYEEQRRTDMAQDLLISLFGSASQRDAQAGSRNQLRKLRWKELSETARRDLRKRREQESAWEPEL